MLGGRTGLMVCDVVWELETVVVGLEVPVVVWLDEADVV
jgi:hypothetical protein